MEQEPLSVTKQKELEAIHSKKERVLEFFKQKGFEPTHPVSEDMWFFHQIGQNPKHLLWQVLANCQQRCQPNIIDKQEEEEIVTVDLFVSELLNSIGLLHLEILDRQMNQEYLTDGQESLKKAKKRLGQENYENQENAVMISYCKNTALVTDIFKVSCLDASKFYSIKYRVATVHQNFQSVYAEDSNRSSTLALDPLDEKIFISILGRRLDRNPDEDYREIAQIELPIFELYQSQKPRHLGLEVIPACYLILTYRDTSVDAPFQDENQIELRFDLRLETDRRLQVIEALEKDNAKNIEELEIKIKDRLELMQQLLSLFGSDPKTAPKDLQYVRARGIGEAKDFPPPAPKQADPDKPKDREGCCVIY